MTAQIAALPSAMSIEGTLQRLYDEAPRVPIRAADRVVIMSDLHLGDGGPRDDFRQNAGLVQEVLRSHYLAAGYSLVLNGDIEELQRFSYARIRARWEPLLALFEEFRRRGALYKILGNHDQGLRAAAEKRLSDTFLDAVCFTLDRDTIFLFHGHQATIFFERFNGVAGFFLRYVANTLRIPNMPVVYESPKKYLTEHRVYAFSSSRKVVSIIGHTHRPLFESLSKIDTLRFRIEQLCRDYPSVSPRARAAIETAITVYRQELARVWEKDRENGLRSSLYNEQISIPCLFNSGCGIGKRGVTAMEIADGEIALVHWFDRTRGERHMKEDGKPARRLGDTDYYRSVLKQDKLQYIFTRIRLLA
ncbi:MAG: metallophosphoesterase family protein [Spirochaetia bacterium]